MFEIYCNDVLVATLHDPDLDVSAARKAMDALSSKLGYSAFPLTLIYKNGDYGHLHVCF